MKRPTDFFSVSDIKRNARKLPKGDVRYAIAEELLRLLWLKPSCKCRWQGTTTDLVELVYFIYSEGLLIDDKGFPLSFRILTALFFGLLQVKIPANPSAIGYCPQNVCKLQSSSICGEIANQTKNNEADNGTKIGNYFRTGLERCGF